MQLKSELYKEMEIFAWEKPAGEVGRSCLTSLPKRVVSCNFYRLSQIFLSSLHSQNLIYSWILWQIIQRFADVMDGNWVILCSQNLCPLIQLWNQELPNYPSALPVWLLSSVFVGQGIFGGSQRSGCSRCALPCGKGGSCSAFCHFHDDSWGEDTQEEGTRWAEQLGSSCTAFLQLTCGLWLLCQAPAFGFGLFWKENRSFCLTTEAAASGFVVLMLMSSGRVFTHSLNPKVVAKLSDFSTQRKKVKHFEVLPEIKSAE